MEIDKKNHLTVKEYNQLRESVGWKTFPDQQVEFAFQQSITIVALYRHKELVGMGRLVGDGIYYLIVDVVVKPSYQGKGLGKEIINSLINATYQNMLGNRASLQLIAAKGKEDFYKKLGFECVPNEDSGNGMRKFIVK